MRDGEGFIYSGSSVVVSVQSSGCPCKLAATKVTPELKMTTNSHNIMLLSPHFVLEHNAKIPATQLTVSSLRKEDTEFCISAKRDQNKRDLDY